MEKSLIVTVYVDGVPLSKIEDIQAELELVFDAYSDRRITIQIQDEQLVRRPRQ